MKLKVLFLVILIQCSKIMSSCTVGTLTEVSGSPFSTGANPQWVAFSPVPSGNLFAAVTNGTSANMSVYSVNTSTGFFTQVAGSPFALAAQPEGLAFSPSVSGNIFLAAVTQDTNPGHVYVFSVNQSTGVLTGVTGSPFTAGNTPFGIAFSPLVGANLFAAVSNNGGTVSIFSVNTSTGQFTLNSTFSTGLINPEYIAFSPLVSGSLFAAVTFAGSAEIVIYSVNTSTGAFTQVSTASVAGPVGVSFSQNSGGNLFVATANNSGNTLNVFLVNTSTGALTAVPGSPFAQAGSPFSVVYSPLVGSRFFAAATSETSGSITGYTVNVASGAFSSANTHTYVPSGIALGAAFSPVVGASQNLFVAAVDGSDTNVHVYSLCNGALPICSCH
jgi:6-phosphogluconolactonase (cycloisomerase 2 family)